MAEIHCNVVTPEITAVDCQTSFIVLPLEDGEKGIGLSHAPLIGRLGAGELRLRDSAGATKRFFIEGGFVQIARDTVSIMTGRAVPVESLDAARIEERLEHERKKTAPGGDAYLVHDKLLRQLRAQLRIARRPR